MQVDILLTRNSSCPPPPHPTIHTHPPTHTPHYPHPHTPPGSHTAEEKEIVQATQRLINSIADKDFKEYS